MCDVDSNVSGCAIKLLCKTMAIIMCTIEKHTFSNIGLNKINKR